MSPYNFNVKCLERILTYSIHKTLLIPRHLVRMHTTGSGTYVNMTHYISYITEPIWNLYYIALM